MALLIDMKVKNNEWKPIKTPHLGPFISHLLLADDVILFSLDNAA